MRRLVIQATDIEPVVRPSWRNEPKLTPLCCIRRREADLLSELLRSFFERSR